jgi:hypothetical protein
VESYVGDDMSTRLLGMWTTSTTEMRLCGGKRGTTPVLFSVERKSEAKFWDGGLCGVVGEGAYDGEYQEGEGGQEWGAITSGSNSS